MNYDQLLAKYADFRIPWGPIGEPVFKRTYSHTKLFGGKETWPETAVRAIRGNVELVAPEFIEEQEDEKLADLLLPFDGLPAGRHLNASGIKGRQFLFNCHASGWDAALPWDHFTFLFDALMQGGGVGANYSNRYLDALPVVERFVHLHIVCRADHPDIKEFQDLLSGHNGSLMENLFVVPDTREGWVEAVEKILRAAWTKNCMAETELTIDVSGIRERGRPLKTSGGIACGPGPLVSMLMDFVKAVNTCVSRKVTSLDAMAMDHSLASCVVAGGKRRSSRMSVKNWMDHDIFEFINCKRIDGSHWSTNISVEVDDEFFWAYEDTAHTHHKQAKAVMRSIILGKRSNGEPGVWNRSLSMQGEREPEEMYCPNPCGEIGLQMWENCFTGETPVLTVGGYRPIASLVGQTVKVISALSSDTDTDNATPGVFNATVFATGKKSIYKITTLDGRVLRTTEEHPFLVDTDDGRKWVTTKNLQPGDLLVASKTSLPHAIFVESQNVSTPYYALGHFLGDGWFLRTNGKLSMGICAGEKDVKLLDILLPAWENLIDSAKDYIEGVRDDAYSNKLKVTKDERTNVSSICFFKPHLARMLEQKYGFQAGTAPTKRFPTGYWSWAANDKASFLRGLFDADGTVHDGDRALAHLACANPEFGRDFMNALSEFGIVGRMTIQHPREGRTQCCIMIRGKDNLTEFYKLLYLREKNTYLTRKGDALEKILQTRKLKTSSDLLEILSIEPDGEEETFNMEVDKSHNFIANGVVTHNCNLGHINLQHFANRPTKETLEAFRLMTRWLVRATFGDITNPRQRAVVNKNRRIGVGFFGFHGFLALRGIRYSDSWNSEEVINLLTKAKKVVAEEAEKYATQLGIPVPVKNTTLAPTGTIAILPGVSSSAQAVFAGWYKRRVRYSDMDPELEMKKNEGYVVYPDPDARNTSIVEYWCEDPLVARVRANGLDPAELIEAQDDITLDTSLNVQTMLQKHWADNGISFTINMPVDRMPTEEDMEAAFIAAMPKIKGTTFFPDKSRKNSPFERIDKVTFDAWTGQKEVSSIEDLCKGGCPVK